MKPDPNVPKVQIPVGYMTFHQPAKRKKFK